MSRFIQPLEQRMFLSVSSTNLSTDLATVRSAATTVRTDLTGLRKNISADLKTLSSDVRALKVSSNNRLLAKLAGDNGVGFAKMVVAEANLLATGEGLSTVVTAEGKLLLLKPTNTKLAAKLATDTANLNSKVASKVTALQTAETNWQTTDDANLSAIAANNSSSTKVAADVSTTEADIPSGLASYNSAVNTFKAAVTALTTDLDSIS
jgi:hypothetical protein